MIIVWIFIIGIVEYLTGYSLGGLLAPFFAFVIQLFNQLINGGFHL